MKPRDELQDLMMVLPPNNLADVARYARAIYDNAAGPAECLCCGRKIPEVRGTPSCGGYVTIMGRTSICSNEGRHWKLIRVQPLTSPAGAPSHFKQMVNRQNKNEPIIREVAERDARLQP